MTEALVLEKINKSFSHGAETIRAVDDVSLAIHANEFFTLLGPSGCGKTTLLRLIAGLETVDSGRIILFGEDIAPLPAHRRPVNTVFQSYALFPHMTVAENVGFGLKMQRRENIAASVTGALRLVRMELKRLQRDTGITFIFVTHDQDEALSMSDRVAVMDRGKVVQQGSPRDIYDRPATRFVADFIGNCNFVKPEALGLAAGKENGFRPEDATFSDSGDTITVAEDQSLLLKENEKVRIFIDPERLIRCT